MEPSSAPDFDVRTLPWPDRENFDEELQQRQRDGSLSPEMAVRFEEWRKLGFTRFPKLIPDSMIEALLEDYERFWSNPGRLKILAEDLGTVALADAPRRDQLAHHHYRLIDIQDASEAARRVMLMPEVVEFLTLLFEATPVGMQSLFFEYGSEQGWHQDFPYVCAQTPSHLVGCWIACEDTDDDNGPLMYLPGSHRIQKFDWGGGSLLAGESSNEQINAFGKHIERESAASGIQAQHFHARKGDVFLWHAALAHRGGPVLDSSRTRKSFVAHYSDVDAYPFDRRWPSLRPGRYARNGGLLYQMPKPAPLLGLLNSGKRMLKRLTHS